MMKKQLKKKNQNKCKYNNQHDDLVIIKFSTEKRFKLIKRNKNKKNKKIITRIYRDRHVFSDKIRRF